MIPDSEKCPRCKGTGRRRPAKLGPPYKCDPAQVMKLLGKGMRAVDVAAKLAVNRSTIYKIIEKEKGRVAE